MNSGELTECSANYVQTAQPEVASEPRFCAEIPDPAAEFAARQSPDAEDELELADFEQRVVALAPRLGDDVRASAT